MTIYCEGEKVRVTVELNNRVATLNAVVAPEHTFGFNARKMVFRTNCLGFELNAECVKSVERLDH